MGEATEKCPRCCDTANADDREVRDAEAETERSSCCCRHKKRSEEEYKSLIHRLNRIEGQIRGIRGMVEKDIYCADILVQVAAVNSALNGFSKELLAQHVRTCVADDLRAGSEEKLLGEPADQLHGRGGHRQRRRHRQGGTGCGLRRQPQIQQPFRCAGLQCRP